MFAYIGPYKSGYRLCRRIADFLENFCVLERDRDAIYDYLKKIELLDKVDKLLPSFGRTVFIKTHRYDHWNADSTMAMLCLPIMKDLKKDKHGSGFIKDEDVPEEIRSYNAPPKENEWDTDEFWFDRANWVLDEVIWALEQQQPGCDWEEQYWIVQPEIDFEERPEDDGKTSIPLRWKVEGKCDWDGRNAHEERIDNGLRLFGTYWRSWWD